MGEEGLQGDARLCDSAAMDSADQVVNFSYATDEDPWLKRIFIRTIEKTTGQPYLKNVYEQHHNHPVPGETPWAAAIRLLELNLLYNGEALERLPKNGPLVVVANHPFGVVDGLVISYLTSTVRDDFVVLTNAVLYQAEEIRRYLLPVDFSETEEALDTNIKTRAAAKLHLQHGGCLIVFPAGGASTAPRPWSKRAIDAEWKNLSAKLIVGAKAPVLPFYFAGQNSRLFQLASHISMTLRLSLFFREVYDKIGGDIHIRVGEVIPYAQLEALDRKELMEYLRKVTYGLGGGLPEGPIRGRRPRLLWKSR
jgi:putative hemolysin